MTREPSVVDVDLFRELLAEQVQCGEITNAEARRCWQIHAVPVILWRRAEQARMRAQRRAGVARTFTGQED